MFKWLFGPSARLTKLNQSVAEGAQAMMANADRALEAVGEMDANYRALLESAQAMPDGPSKETMLAQTQSALAAVAKSRAALEQQLSSATQLKEDAQKYLKRA